MNTKKISTSDIVLTALFATLTCVGTMIRIPLPSAVGAPFIHLGNAVVLLGILFLGFKKGALAGGTGFAIFDITHGYASEAPYFFLECFVVAGIATLVWKLFNYKDDKVYKIVVVCVFASIARLTMSFLQYLVMAMLMGSSFFPALTASFLSLPATLINCISTCIIVPFVYYPVKKIVSSFHGRSAIHE